MGEHKLKEEQERQAAAAKHVAETSLVPAAWANQVSVGMTCDGHIRLTYGEVIHPTVPPKFHGAVVLPLQVAEAIANIILSVVKQHKETMEILNLPGEVRPEPEIQVKDFTH